MLKNQIKGKNNSWAIRWYMSAFLKGMFTLYPKKPYVQNIGNDGSGTHCGISNVFIGDLESSYSFEKIDIKEDLVAKKKIEVFLNSIKATFFQTIRERLLRFIK